jgi:hypothetical protein
MAPWSHGAMARLGWRDISNSMQYQQIDELLVVVCHTCCGCNHFTEHHGF